MDVPTRIISTELTVSLAIIAPTLLPFITKSKTGVVSYNPQRVMRQLGYDQSAIQITGERGYSSLMTTESQFTAMGGCTLFPSLRKLFLA